VNVLLSNRGTVLKSDVVGQVIMKTQLSGMPECKFGINDKLLIRDNANAVDGEKTQQKGIQCVRLGKFDRDRSITFIPPDGLFEVMTYRVSQSINLPFKITPVIQEFPDDNRIEYSVKLRAIFEHSNFANNVVVKIPVPSNTANVKIYGAGIGKGKYEPDKSAILWRIKKF
jgi:AP-2 complex subunit mu-1